MMPCSHGPTRAKGHQRTPQAWCPVHNDWFLEKSPAELAREQFDPKSMAANDVVARQQDSEGGLR